MSGPAEHARARAGRLRRSARRASAWPPPRRARCTCAWAAPACRAVYADDVELELGRAYVLREGADVTIVACGVEVEQALKAAAAAGRGGRVEAEVIDAFSVKPLDEETILASAGKTGCAVVCRGAQRRWGAWARPWPRRWPRTRPGAVRRSWACATPSANRASSSELMAYFNLDARAIVEAVKKRHGREGHVIESSPSSVHHYSNGAYCDERYQPRGSCAPTPGAAAPMRRRRLRARRHRSFLRRCPCLRLTTCPSRRVRRSSPSTT